MTDATTTPDPDEEPTGTFVGGTFGTAPEEEPQQDPQEGRVVAAASPAQDPTDESPTEAMAPADTEGVAPSEVLAPGERNDPV